MVLWICLAREVQFCLKINKVWKQHCSESNFSFLSLPRHFLKKKSERIKLESRLRIHIHWSRLWLQDFGGARSGSRVFDRKLKYFREKKLQILLIRNSNIVLILRPPWRACRTNYRLQYRGSPLPPPTPEENTLHLNSTRNLFLWASFASLNLVPGFTSRIRIHRPNWIRIQSRSVSGTLGEDNNQLGIGKSSYLEPSIPCEMTRGESRGLAPTL